MKGKQFAGILAGAFLAFLGLLWLLQGTGVLRVKPLVCVTNCEEIIGGSSYWAGAGAVAFMIGIIIIFLSVRHISDR